MSSLWPDKLLRWYDRCGRDLPWRRTVDPYAIWLSEIMLQQTRIDTVLPYYRAFLRRFPSVQRLAKARVHEVLQLWQGLGYYSRARRLPEAARQVLAAGGIWPQSQEEWRCLPGVGPYTAAALASICNGQAVAAVDGNVLRVASRFLADAGDICSVRTRAAIGRTLTQMIPADRPGDFNQAMMDLGALICLPRAPHCTACPLRNDCQALAKKLTAQLPVRRRRGAVQRRGFACALVWHRGRILLHRRADTGLLGGLWDLPHVAQAAATVSPRIWCQAMQSQYQLWVLPTQHLGVVRHTYSHFVMDLSLWRCRLKPGTTRPADCRWVLPAHVRRYPVGTAFLKALEGCAPGDEDARRGHPFA